MTSTCATLLKDTPISCSSKYFQNPNPFRSLASLEAKISYLQRNLNRQLKQEKAFPLVLYYSYNKVLRPRGDLLKDRHNHFKLEEAFGHPDKQFCQHWGIDPSELQQARRQRHRKNDTERDVMWQYVLDQ